MKKWRTPHEVCEDVLVSDWNNITLAGACKLADFELYKAVGQLVCMRIDCKDCPINPMMYRDDCEFALGKHLLGGEKID